MRIAIKPQPHGGAVSWFRGTGPAAELVAFGHEPCILHSGMLKPEYQRQIVREADVVHLIGFAGETTYEKAPAEWHERRGVLSVDLDDDLWCWNDDPAAELTERARVSPDAGRAVTDTKLRAIESWMRAADIVTTTTEHLAGVIRSHVPDARVEVVPNAVPREAARTGLRPRELAMQAVAAQRAKAATSVKAKAGLEPCECGSGKTRRRCHGDPRNDVHAQHVIAWTGSVAHVQDLPPALAGIAKVRSVDGHVTVRSLGPVDFMDSPGFRKYFKDEPTAYTQTKYVLPDGRQTLIVPFEAYYQSLESMDPDVAVIPMRASAFNASKSAITLYSWGVRGVPCVVSRFGPYAEAEREGFPAVYVDHEDVDAWAAGIRSLIYDRGAAAELGRKALAWTLERHALPEGSLRWVEAWERACARRGVQVATRLQVPGKN